MMEGLLISTLIEGGTRGRLKAKGQGGVRRGRGGGIKGEGRQGQRNFVSHSMAATPPCLNQRRLSETNATSVACIFSPLQEKKRTAEDVREKLAADLKKRKQVDQPKKNELKKNEPKKNESKKIEYSVGLALKQDYIFLNVSSVEKPLSSEAWQFVNSFKFTLRPIQKALEYVTSDDMNQWQRFCIDENALCGSYEKTLEHKLISEKEFDTVNTAMRRFNADGTCYYQGTKEWSEYVMQEVFGQILTFDAGIVGKFKYRSFISFDLDRVRRFVERLRHNHNNAASSLALRLFLDMRKAPFSNSTFDGLPAHFALGLNNQNMELGSVVKDFYVPVIVKYMTPVFNNMNDLDYPTGTLQYFIYSKRDDTVVQDSARSICVYFCMRCFKTGCFQPFVDVTRYKFHLFYCKNSL